MILINILSYIILAIRLPNTIVSKHNKNPTNPNAKNANEPNVMNNAAKMYAIFKCPNCKQKLRAPRGRGKIQVTCSKCRTQFIKKV